MIHFLLLAAASGLVAWIVAEAAGVFTRLATLLIRNATRFLPDDRADRYRREWLAELDAVPGPGIVKLRWALSVTAGAGVMAHQGRAKRPHRQRRTLAERLVPQPDELFAFGLILLLVAAYLAQKERSRVASRNRVVFAGRSSLTGPAAPPTPQFDLVVSDPPYGVRFVECKTYTPRPGLDT